MAADLVITVEEIKGMCPIFNKGDKFYIRNGFVLDTEKEICLHALAALMPFYTSLSRGIKPADLGLGKDKYAYVQCLDPCEFTNGGTVIFKIRREKTKKLL